VRPHAFSLLAAVLVGAALPRAAAGDHAPTVWERASDPTAAMRDVAHHAATVLGLEAEELRERSEPKAAEESLQQARRILEAAGATTSRDVRLRLDYGFVLSELKEDHRAVAALRDALAEAPDESSAARALYAIAISSARLDRPADEIEAYDRYLRLQTQPGSRANALYNRADAKMRLGRVAESIDDYRASLAVRAQAPVVLFGLAVALDRAGDPVGATREALRAIQYDPLDREMNSPNVFFVPPYERSYYDALGAMVRAGMVDDPETASLWWEMAVARWGEYMVAGGPSDRWYGLAKAHRAEAARKVERQRVKRRAATPRRSAAPALP
jgi:tetratricopeptide (TPR) repeat protein